MAGQPFLINQFPSGKVFVEASIGADLTDIDGSGWSWTEITADLMKESQVTITQGRADDTSQAQSASCTFALNNTSGNYTPFNPLSTFYPNWKRSTPIRVRVDLGSGATTIFLGFLTSSTPAWDTSARKATVDVVANGLLSRLDRRRTPLQSALYRSIVTTSPTAYWPMDDGQDATSFASGLIGGTPLKVLSGTVEFAGGTPPAGATAVPSLAGTPVVSASVATTGTGWSVGFAYSATGTATGSQRSVLKVLTDTGFTFGVLVADGSPTRGNVGLLIEFFDNTGTLVSGSVLDKAFANMMDGTWHWVQATATPSGANVAVQLYIDGSLIGSTSSSGTCDPGHIRSVQAGYFPDIADSISDGAFQVGSLAVWGGITARNMTSAMNGYVGELADTRMARLAAENNIQLTVTGTSNITMGTQPIASISDALRECEAADGGVLFDGFDAGLRYICRSSIYNQPADVTVDANSAQLTPPFAPVDDDQRIVNDFTASQPSGSSARYIDSTGPVGTNAVGTYDQSATVNVDTTDELLAAAAWRVHLGTVEGLRFPSHTHDFAAVPALAQSWLNAQPPPFRTDINNADNVASQAPPDNLNLLVEGWTAVLDTVSWKVTENCSPEQPWHAASIETGTYPLRIDSSDSTLVTSASSGATSLTVASPTGPWTTTAQFPADFPFAAGIAGEQITVTAIASLGKDAFGRTVANGWGTADIGGAWTTTGGSASDYAVGSGVGTMTQTTAAVSRIAYLAGISVADFDVTCQVQVSATATGAGLRGYLLGRYSNAANSFYRAVLHFETTGVATLQLWKRVTGTDTQLTGVNLFNAYSPATFYTLRFVVRGSTLTAWAWPTATPGQTVTTSTTDSALSAAGNIGFSGVTVSGNTNVNPVITCDNFEITSPQTFTVTRSVNGIAKSQNAGAAVALWRPAVIAL